MFSNAVIDNDIFLDMPLSTQALYFHLGMKADDDGFVGSPKKIVRAVNCTEDDFKLLVSKGFVLCFASGVIVITHWNINNIMRKDRRKPTIYTDEKAELTTEKNDTYTICQPDVNRLSTNCQPTDNQMTAQNKLNKSKENNIVGQDPTAYSSEIEAVVDYLNSKLGSHYLTSTKSTRKHITARLKEGYAVEDFKTVIESKCAEWLGTDKQKYLRPETLFGSKFEGYLNAARMTATKSDDKSIDKLMKGYNRK